MRYVIIFPHRSLKRIDQWLGGGEFADSARAAEDAGFDAFMVFDHPLPSDQWVSQGGHHSYDPFVALSFAAAATQRMRLLTGVLIGAYRNPYITAKALASLDHLSGGRCVAGMAAGYLKPEFDVLGVGELFRSRGRVLDDTIDAMRDVWRGQTLDREAGPYPAVGHTALPPPVDQTIPIWIGGNAAPATRRAVERGDGWMPAWLPPQVATAFGTDSLHTLELMAERTAAAQRQRHELGKPPLEIACSPYDDMRTDWTSGCSALKSNLAAYEQAGVDWLMIEPSSRSLEDFRRDVATFNEIVMRAT